MIVSLSIVTVTYLDTFVFCFVFFRFTEKKLKGLVVWITGASSGIGEELAYQLASCGSLLVLSARREEELNRVKRSCLGEIFLIFHVCKGSQLSRSS